MIQTANLKEEQVLWRSGFKYVCGLDEVGRGCFGGPVVVGAVIFSPSQKLPDEINDSKLVRPKIRQLLSEEIKKSAISWTIATTQVSIINQLGIAKATQLAFRKAVSLLSVVPDYLLVDAFYIEQIDRGLQKPIKKGDRISKSIAAASILAKVYRDNLMNRLDHKYPEYGFKQHKGYGTKIHQEAIRKYGLCPIHRTSFNLSKFLR